jgi:outer membrane lipoprotein SlyB
MVSKIAVFFVATLAMPAVAAQNIDIQYGVVTDIKTAKSSGTSNTGTGAAAGGLLGGLLGATSSKNNSSGDKRRRSLFYGAGGAVVGGVIGSATSGKKATIYEYSVKLLQGNTTTITTEQGRIDRGDCVSIEQGKTANIRKVAQVICDVPEPGIAPGHREEAKECSDAKQELVAAQGGEAIDTAIRKIKILCDD